MSVQMLKELSTWKLDAKFEEVNRYFYNVDEFQSIINGERCFVIGRKGSGKTAISEKIYIQSDPRIFTEKLTFKNFPFNELYSLHNNQYTRPNQYITLWKYLIYSSICRMMVRNQSIDFRVRAALEKIYGGTEPAQNLSRLVSRWVTGGGGLSILGIGGQVTGAKTEPEVSAQSWIERVDVLEDVISQYLDDGKYYILFDELDEDYRSIVDLGDSNSYLSLITSLFKAVQVVRAIFGRSKNIFPVIFLRDDIYDLVLDPDKNKWDDFRIDLDWNQEQIKNLLAFRLSRAMSENEESHPFNQVWWEAFERRPINVGHRQQKPMDSFDYMTLSTHLRPRDYVRYIQECATDTLARKRNKITPETLLMVDKAFSNYLRDELVDEMHGLLPDIQEILSVLSEIRKWNFTIQEFKAIFQHRVENGTIKSRDADFVLKTLFHFSVIGNQNRPGITFFRYTNKEARFNFRERLVVHRGLFKAMQII